jgi:Kef-type K+ transport system membrane component KefB
MYCGLIILVATLGKLGARCWLPGGLGCRPEKPPVGTLMNTRGLMELVILNIGLDIKVISPAVFSMMVLMALTTTFMTSPVLQAICPDKILCPQVEAEAEQQDGVQLGFNTIGDQRTPRSEVRLRRSIPSKRRPD